MSNAKRGYHGVYSHISPKHLERYIGEFAGRHNIIEEDKMDQMREVATRMVGKRIKYDNLVTKAKVAA